MAGRDVTEEEKRRAQLIAVQESEGPSALRKLQEDIRGLVGQNQIAQNKFSEIGLKLTEVDNGKLPDGSPINPGAPFFPPWQELQHRFDALVNDSNDTASTLGTYCKSFDGIILPFSTGLNDGPPLTKEEKLHLLNSFADDAERNRSVSAAIKRRFDALINDINQFSRRFTGFAVDRIENNKIKIAELQAAIVKLQSDIDSLTTQINILAASIGLTVFISLAALALFPEFAAAILGVAGSAIGAIGTAIANAQKQIDEKQGQITVDTKEIAVLMREIEILEAAQRVLGGIENEDIPQLTSALSAFSGIWGNVIDEILEVKKYVELGQGSVDAGPVVYAYLQEAASVYRSLGQGLMDYAQNIFPGGFSARATRAQESAPLPKWAKVNPAVEKAARKLIDRTPLARF